MNSQASANTFRNLVDMRAAYIDSVVPFRDRFYSFLRVNATNVPNVVAFALPDPEEFALPASSAFDLLMKESVEGDGLYFWVDLMTDDGIEQLHFIMPFEYMDDPDAWEQKILAENKAIRDDALEAYLAEVPFMRGKVDVTVIDDYAPNSTLLVTVRLKKDKVGFVNPADVEFNQFAFMPATKELSHKYFNAYCF